MARSQFCEAYAEDNPECELHTTLRAHRRFMPYVSDRVHAVLKRREYLGVITVHHIFRGQKRRIDNRSNIISVSPWVHLDYLEGPYRTEATLVCLGVKLAKNELDVDELQDASGKQFNGWLEMAEPHWECWTFPFWEALTRHLEEGARR